VSDIQWKTLNRPSAKPRLSPASLVPGATQAYSSSQVGLSTPTALQTALPATPLPSLDPGSLRRVWRQGASSRQGQAPGPLRRYPHQTKVLFCVFFFFFFPPDLHVSLLEGH